MVAAPIVDCTQQLFHDFSDSECSPARKELTSAPDICQEFQAWELRQQASDSSPEELWTEHLDEHTGCKFFHNAVTGQSSWTRPSFDTDTLLREAVAVARWTEHVDPVTQNAFYYNSATGETSWVKPATAVESQAEDDWVESFDPESGKTYYYNARTWESLWTRPVQLADACDSREDRLDSEGQESDSSSILSHESSWMLPLTVQYAKPSKMPPRYSTLAKKKTVSWGGVDIQEYELPVPESCRLKNNKELLQSRCSMLAAFRGRFGA